MSQEPLLRAIQELHNRTTLLDAMFQVAYGPQGYMELKKSAERELRGDGGFDEKIAAVVQSLSTQMAEMQHTMQQQLDAANKRAEIAENMARKAAYVAPQRTQDVEPDLSAAEALEQAIQQPAPGPDSFDTNSITALMEGNDNPKKRGRR